MQGTFPQGRLINSDQRFSNWSPEATLTWKPQSNLTLYAAYKTGYKSGGFSNNAVQTQATTADDLSFRPERASGFEGGVKSMLFDNTLRFNVAAYSYKFKGLQTDFFISQIPAFITTNAGSATTKGIEIETEWSPRRIDGFSVNGSLNYNDAKYVYFVGPCYAGQTIAQGCSVIGLAGARFQDLGGKSLMLAPRWTATLGMNLERPIGNGLALNVSADARYSGSYLASNSAIPASRQSRYVSLDGMIGLSTENKGWELALIGKNLTNRFILTGTFEAPFTGSGTGSPVGVPSDLAGLVASPRTVQIRATRRF
jgi:outer membrane receptor protein involved in Fe transport